MFIEYRCKFKHNSRYGADMPLQSYAKLTFKKLLPVGFPEKRLICLLPIFFAREEHIPGEPFIHIVVASMNLCVGMTIPKRASGTQISTCHAWKFLEVEDALTLRGEWAAHATESPGNVDLPPPIGVIAWRKLKVSVFDKSKYILVGPVEYGINGFHMVFFGLASVEATLRRLVVSLVALTALTLAHPHDALVEYLIFLQHFATEARKAIRETFLRYQLKERLFGSAYLHTHTFDVGNSARRVDGGVAIDCTVSDAGFFGKLQNDIGILASGISHLYLAVVTSLHALQKSNGMSDFLL